MTKYALLLLFTSCFTGISFSQKAVHIPNYLQNPNTVDGGQFSWDKTAQSANFILIWGNTVGTNPASYPDPNLAFNPAAILDTMEFIYSQFKMLEFLDDAPGTNLSEYKIPIVIYGTWGSNGAQGFANGGDADGIIGAFWVHPNAMHDGGVAAHELTHSLQAQAVIDYRTTNGLGAVWNNAGIFWETHGNFMRNLLYPQFVSAWGMDVHHLETWGDWKNTYENYEMLLAIMESEGIGMVNRLWRESYTSEYPLQAYKRLAGYGQAEFNDSLYRYARRMATFDFNHKNIGNYFRQYRSQDLQNFLPSVQRTYSILKKIPGANQRYEMPVEQAPEEFAYNVIPLYPEAGGCPVIVKFKGHTGANAHAGWRYGFVAANSNGKVSRYSPVYRDNTAEIHFALEGSETKLYLVVMGAPFDQITTNVSNDTWQGYPKHFRFPYELTISGGVPEGFQAPAAFRAQLKSNGHLHANGGGWVQNSASVAASVYVGPMAMVLGNATLSGQVRVENTALVKNATLSGQVRVLDNAFIDRGTYSGSAILRGLAFAEDVTMANNAVIGQRARVSNYNLSGNIEVGGDVVVYNENGSCNNGVYYRLTNYYDDKLLECDNRTAAHPANLDVNSAYALFSDADMALQCSCGTGAPAITVDSVLVSSPGCSNPAAGSVVFRLSPGCGPFQYAWSKGADSGTNLDGLASGQYLFTITDDLGRTGVFPVTIPDVPALTASVSATPYDCASGAGGQAAVALAGGTPPFIYLWNNGAAVASPGGLTPGIYTVTATDALGCAFTGSVEVARSGQIDVSPVTMPVRCHDSANGSASLVPVNGTAPYAWLWDNGETGSLRTNLGAGAYTVTITDAAGCGDTLQVVLTAPPALELQTTVQAVSCFGDTNGSAAVDVTGGTPVYQYVWSTQDTSAAVSNLGAGAYAVTVTDAAGCSETLQIALTEPPALELATTTQDISCFGGTDGSAAVVATGGTPAYQFAWTIQDTSAAVSNLPAGEYSLTVTDAAGCSETQQIVVTAPPALALAAAKQDIPCFGQASGAASVSAGGGTPGYAYHWNTGHATAALTGLQAGDYQVTVTDAHGCSDSTDITVWSPDSLIIQLSAAPLLCPGTSGMVAAGVSGGTPPYGYNWSTGQNDSLIVAGAGDYGLTVTDSNGCPQTIQLSLAEAAPMQLFIDITGTTALAMDGALDINAISGGTPPYHFLWNTGDITAFLDNLSPGTYILTITDGAGCASVFTLEVPLITAQQAGTEALRDVQIVPNPSGATARLWVSSGDAQLLRLTVCNALGQLIYEKQEAVLSGFQTLPLPAGLASGLYQVMLQSGKGRVAVRKWVVGME